MYKSFKTIALDITEEQYREDGALHYSTLATYSRGGFGCLDTLFDRKDSPSLTFGSAVDSIITGGQGEFNERFLVAEFPPLEPAYVNIVKELYNLYKDSFAHLFQIPEANIIQMTEQVGFYRNWKPETRAKVIKEKGSEYYDLLHLAEGKTLIDTELYNQIVNTVNALKESPATKNYFESDNPFDDSIERLYQLKFSGYNTEEGGPLITIPLGANTDNLDSSGYIRYSCMADLIVVNHKTKKVYPCDLKTSSHKEYDFFKSFIDWSYHIQGRLYWRLIRAAMDADEVFKDYELCDYTFIVANGETLNPLTWHFEDTKVLGTLTYGKNNQIECRDPFDLGEELYHYLSSRPVVPTGIDLEKPNSLTKWLNTL